MKKNKGRAAAFLLALLMVLTNLPATPVWAEAGDVEINATNFPDATFREFVSRKFDKNGDNKLSQAELDAVDDINVDSDNISSLKGLEHFTKLKVFNCIRNKLTTLDVSKNPDLENLACSMNKLTSLDVSNNPKLITFWCERNQLTSIDVSHNPGLKYFICDNNQLSALDVSKNSELIRLHCYNNQVLSALDVSKNLQLKELLCNMNQLTSLDVSKNTKLEVLGCSDNKLSSLNVLNNPALTELVCSDNQLTTLDIRSNPALKVLYSEDNQLTDLVARYNAQLEQLYCYNNKLTTLTVHSDAVFKNLYCNKNKLTDLNLRDNALIPHFLGGEQEYEIWVDGSSLTYDLNLLPGNFDSSRASGWTGGSVSGYILKLDDTKPDEVTYEYEAQTGNNLSVTLNVSYGDVVSVIFDKNGGDGYMKNMSLSKGSSFTLPSCEFAPPTGKKFKAWEIDGEVKAIGDSITVDKDTTAKALWTDLSANVESIAVNSTDHKTEYKVGDPLDVSNLTIEVTKSDGTKETVSVTADMVSGFRSDVPATNKELTISYKNKTTTYNINVTSGEYTVSFDPNGGTGTMADVTIKAGIGLQLPDCDFGPPDGKVSEAWDVDGEKIAPNRFIRPTKDTTVKALWKDDTPTPPTPVEKVTITFDENGGTGAMASVTKNQGDSYALPDCTFTAPEGKEFKAWSIDDVEKAVGDNITVNTDTTVKAIWKEATPPTPVEKVTITFDENGGTGTMASVTKNKGDAYELPACTFTAPEDKEFKAWSVGGTEKAVGDNIIVNADTTVKAIWKVIGSPTPPTPPTPSTPSENEDGHSILLPSAPEAKNTPSEQKEEKPVIVGTREAYLSGYPDGSIRPDGAITRAESAKIIALLMGADVSDAGKPAFGDVASGWYNPYINAVVKAGIMKGYPDGTFKPDAPITRAEFAQMIMAIDKANAASAPFADVKGHWAQRAIDQAYGNGRIKGYPDGTFKPDASITRAEAVVICNSLFNRKADRESLKSYPEKMKSFTDLSPSHWAYYEIMEASNRHE